MLWYITVMNCRLLSVNVDSAQCFLMGGILIMKETHKLFPQRNQSSQTCLDSLARILMENLYKTLQNIFMLISKCTYNTKAYSS